MPITLKSQSTTGQRGASPHERLMGALLALSLLFALGLTGCNALEDLDSVTIEDSGDTGTTDTGASNTTGQDTNDDDDDEACLPFCEDDLPEVMGIPNDEGSMTECGPACGLLNECAEEFDVTIDTLGCIEACMEESNPVTRTCLNYYTQDGPNSVDCDDVANELLTCLDPSMSEVDACYRICNTLTVCEEYPGLELNACYNDCVESWNLQDMCLITTTMPNHTGPTCSARLSQCLAGDAGDVSSLATLTPTLNWLETLNGRPVECAATCAALTTCGEYVVGEEPQHDTCVTECIENTNSAFRYDARCTSELDLSASTLCGEDLPGCSICSKVCTYLADVNTALACEGLTYNSDNIDTCISDCEGTTFPFDASCLNTNTSEDLNTCTDVDNCRTE